MVGLCEAGNEPAGSLKAISKYIYTTHAIRALQGRDMSGEKVVLLCTGETFTDEGYRVRNFETSTDKMSSQNDDYVEAVVCQDSDIQENEMKAFELGDAGKILLVKQNGKLSAVGAKCTHYGAPLDTGVLGEGRVRCPWHGACFNVTTGDIEDFPGLDSLPCYQVEVQDGGGVKVRAKREHVKSNKRVKDMVKRDKTVVSTFVTRYGSTSVAMSVHKTIVIGMLRNLILFMKYSFVTKEIGV
ncbi:hypothetical protein ANN_19491 [Periplaneta americana]|uniref:Rieske domain-containing protein n=1 Tax=Periplaneta americana TaxID=6978 RepID=A0ABQ8SA27_PERAM|nr:hypothetical protein ANN_19491 [Periplaneta americana]